MRLSWFEQGVSLHNGLPSHHTFGHVFSLSDPEALQVCFSNRIKDMVKDLVKRVTADVIALDGKYLRPSHVKSLSAIWCF